MLYNTIEISQELRLLQNKFSQQNISLYAVGGLVRNSLLGYPISDTDICSSASVEDVHALLKNDPHFHIIDKAPEFGTVEIHVYLDPDNRKNKLITEHTTFRSEVYNTSGEHRPQEVVFTDSLTTDAYRRDFSINALYYDLEKDVILDPTGGLPDLEQKLIRTTSEDADVILQDDGLRILRMVRFACELGFSIEGASYDSAKRNAYLLADISVERIWQEFQKILMADVRYNAPVIDNMPAHYRGLKLLNDMGALKYIFPELYEGEYLQQRSDYHAFTVMEHNLYSCACSAPVLSVRLASLLHDIGKPFVYAKTQKMLMHDKEGALIAKDMLIRLKVPNSLVDEVTKLVRIHMYDLDNNAHTKTIKKYFAQLGIDLTTKFILVREADFVGSGKQSLPVASAERFKAILADMIARNTPFSENDLKVTGEDIMETLSIKPSMAIGVIKKKLFLHCAIYPADNYHKRLIALIPQYYKQYLMELAAQETNSILEQQK